MALAARLKHAYSFTIVTSHTCIQTRYTHQTTFTSSSSSSPPSLTEYASPSSSPSKHSAAQRIKIFKNKRVKRKLKEIAELEQQQSLGRVLDPQQLFNLGQKAFWQHTLADIESGTFSFDSFHPVRYQHHAPSAAKHIPRSKNTHPYPYPYPHSTASMPPKTPPSTTPRIKPLKRHQLLHLLHFDDALNINEKFEKFLSRPTYSIWAVRELFASMTGDDWQNTPTEYIRHILDAYYVRNNLHFVYKLLMKWFPKPLAKRYTLYSDLCRKSIEYGNLQIAHEVFQYLLYSLMTSKNIEVGDAQPTLLWFIYDAMNALIPKIIESGQFHIFDELLAQLIELRTHKFLPDIDAVLSNTNLALLWTSCVQNESITRLLVIIEWINRQQQADARADEAEEHNLQRFTHKLSHTDIMRALVLAINANNTQLFAEIVALCGHKIHDHLQETLSYCIEHQLLHCVLHQHHGFAQLSQMFDLQTVRLRIGEFQQIIDTYCVTFANKNSTRIITTLEWSSWCTICDWFLRSLREFDLLHDAVLAVLNDFVFYFAGVECRESLERDNMGDALRWMELVDRVLTADGTNAHYIATAIQYQYGRHSVHGVVVGLQLMAVMHRFDMLSRAINNLPHAMMEEYCETIVQCMAAKDVHAQVPDLHINADGLFDLYAEHESTTASVYSIRQAFKIIQCLDRLNAFESKIKNQGWIQGERNYRHKLQDMLQNLNEEDIAALKRQSLHDRDHEFESRTRVNGSNGTHHKLLPHSGTASDGSRNDDMDWFNALENLAFNEE